MSSYRQHLYHIVFRTKSSLNTINQVHVNDLYAYFTGILKNKKCHLYRINGIANHIHILTDINPSLAPIDFVKDIKAVKSLVYIYPWLRQGLFIFGSFRANCYNN
jgi:putative transposase